MSGSDIFGIIAISSLGLPVLALGILLLNGKCAFLIMSEEDKEKYNKAALCRFMGWFMVAVSFCVMIIFVGAYFGTTRPVYCGVAFILVITVGAAIYANKGDRFRKNDNSEVLPITSRAAQSLAVVLISGIIAFPAGAMIYLGEKEPVVNILESSIQIRAAYGLNIDFTDIAGISLIENSMSAIGTGRRANGYGGVGETLKGNFKSNSLGDILLFVKSESSPTIRIERIGNKDVYISFRNDEKTELLYREMIAAVPIK